MKILVLSKYSRKGASSRYRMFQYFQGLQAKGIHLEVEALFDDQYLERLYSKKNRIGSVVKAYAKRLRVLFKAKDFDVIWLEKELLPWMPWFIEKGFLTLLKTPYVIEYDDAIFHQYDQHPSYLVRQILGQKCDQLMRHSSLVLAGNEYLATRAQAAGAPKVTKIPTVVSSKVFVPSEVKNTEPVIGWIGSLSTAIYLENLRPVFSELKKKYNFKVRIVGAEVDWPEIDAESIPWSEAQEVALVQSFDIGIMPLLDSPWERGKCGFKLIQYMACGKAVVADPVGVNAEIVQNQDNGFLVSPGLDWYGALEKLLTDSQLRSKMGQSGRARFIENYSLENWQDKLYLLFAGFQDIKSQKKK